MGYFDPVDSYLSLFQGDDSQRETTPFLHSDDDGQFSYDGKNMALFEVHLWIRINSHNKLYIHMYDYLNQKMWKY